FLENEHLHIHIRNTGVLGGKESGGFGLKNTERRLQLLYGDDATLFRIFQESEEVVRAEIVLPTQTEGIFRRENTKTNLP
ncbi:MAG: sensor histidine kinase, partial [Runella slithyformis]